MPIPPRWRLILNGKSAGDDALRDAVSTMRQRGIALDVRVTWEDGDAERYVSEAIADGADTIIAAGGDGTLSEVATTLAHRDEPATHCPRWAWCRWAPPTISPAPPGFRWSRCRRWS